MPELTRRHFVIGSALLFSGPIAPPAAAAPTSPPSMWNTWDAQVTPPNYDPATTNPWGFHPRFLPQRVEANPGLTPGDIHVDAVARYLYHIEPGGGTAMRYGVAIARGNLYEPGRYRIGRKAKWPTWRPTDAMIERDPQYAEFADGMDGGPNNPLGSRAFYLYTGNRDTYLRIHGTPLPRSIGSRASSGCVRMVMAHIIGLYENVAVGSMATLYPAERPLGEA
ncbi:putative L,D-transpeptidase YnhG precursor [Pseudoruegeria aquimaris]|uniref:Putative L,D-transpeptidase YnhG n=1 Tax=Pseudoruegeria aquimaris TaxID=393663 RepID=A0A1Y5RDI3_9RHOB|nr:L,D-transpeptidase [Pseudoruegeria aquimaris]SLN14090.1 putative L,D-transpeptidase YnhG precursor [Pseudoruegeria aquimaris]